MKELSEAQLLHLAKARVLAQEARVVKRARKQEEVKNSNQKLKHCLGDSSVSKLIIATLYLGEGSKNPNRGSIVFGNSSPKVILLFLSLLRRCYQIDETKFRCTVQCRADQDCDALNCYWSGITQIPLQQFYRARVDKRTIGVSSKNVEYKGVCRIDYFSATILLDLLMVIDIIT
jgi:hypothetical protein